MYPHKLDKRTSKYVLHEIFFQNFVNVWKKKERKKSLVCFPEFCKCMEKKGKKKKSLVCFPFGLLSVRGKMSRDVLIVSPYMVCIVVIEVVT